MSDSPETRPSLLVRLRDPRDEQAWGEFVEIYEPLVYRLARRRGFQDADARELVQDVLVTVASAIERWNPDRTKGSFRGWLFTVARNLMINFLTKKNRQPIATGDSEMCRWLNEHPDPGNAESALFDQDYRRQTFLWAAEQIRDEFRSTTWEAFWQTSVIGHTVQVVSSRLGVTVGVVYVSRSRVMARLRETIERLEQNLLE